MRPNHSVLFSLKLSRSPLGVIFNCNLLLAFWIAPAGAQTRLDSAQISMLKGDVQGSFASTVLRDINSAADHGNGVSNAIAAAIRDCGSSLTCSIRIPPNYPMGEPVPGYQLNYALPGPPATTPGTIGIVDRRYSDARMFVNNNGYNNGLLNTPQGWLYDYYSKARQNVLLASFDLRQWSLDGGNNQQNSMLGYGDKTTWETIMSNDISHTPGQKISLALGTGSLSLGDTLGLTNSVTCYGGFNAQADLGCHAMDNVIAQGTVEYAGTLTGAPSSGAMSLFIAPTQGQYTQAAGRFLARISAGTISSGSIASIANSYGAAPVVTGSGTSWPVSNVVGQLGTDITSPGIATVTPASFTVGSLAALTTTSLVCVADQESFEMIHPTAVTTTSLTANFTKIHFGSATIASGGVCGYLIDLTADDVTNSTFPTKTQTITGTLHFAFPLIASTSTTSASAYVAGGGAWQAFNTRWNAALANGYVFYPFAEVTSVQQNGGLSDTLTVGPNQVAWTAGDSVSEFLYPSPHYTFGNTVIESYYPNISGANGMSVQYNMPLQGSDTMLSMANNAPASMYRSSGGSYASPQAIKVTGSTSQSLALDQSDTASIGVGCNSPCTSTVPILAAGNAAYFDFIRYDQGNRRWSISANASSNIYYWAANQFTTPFSNTLIAADANQTGYIATQQARSNTSTNSDLSGELVFSNSSTLTQSLQGTYASHPECIVRPEFDQGSTNRFWITYTSTSFSVNFASPVSGVVTYSCNARN